uniref:Uncharacterized protein n=1 Tax=Panagrellus redivivus TaxID=6233 RepID=A0A7E5A0R2_PANRE
MPTEGHSVRFRRNSHIETCPTTDLGEKLPLDSYKIDKQQTEKNSPSHGFKRSSGLDLVHKRFRIAQRTSEGTTMSKQKQLSSRLGSV